MKATLLNTFGEIRISGAKIKYHNFAGVETDMNNEGSRNFEIEIPDEDVAELLKEWGYYVKYPEPKDITANNVIIPRLKIQVKYRYRDGRPSKTPPTIHYIELGPDGNAEVDEVMTEEDLGKLDDADIQYCDLDIRRWEYSPGRYSAYAKKVYVIGEADYYAQKYGRK